MAGRLPIPESSKDVTAAWMTEALGAPVASVSLEEIGVGVGMLGEIVRAELAYDGDAGDAPASVVVKLPTQAQANKALGVQFGFYEHEVDFYRDVAPTAAMRVPHCWHADMDPAEQRYVLVLEDLAHLQLADQVAGMTVDQALVACDAVARFHADWWDAPKLADLTWLPDADDPVRMAGVDLFHQYWPGFVERWGHLVPPGGLEVGEAVRDAYADMMRGLNRAPYTIVHADYRLDNLFFGPPGTPDAVCAIDWQLSARGGGVYDVAYLLAQSMTVDLRRRHEERILRAWHDRLLDCGVTGYGLEQARQDYAACMLVCLIIPVGAGAEIDLGNERGEALVGEIVSRGFNAVLDVDWKGVLDRL